MVWFFSSSLLIYLETSWELILIWVCSKYIRHFIDREQPWKTLNRIRRKRIRVKPTEVYFPLSLNDLYSYGFEATRSRFITVKEWESSHKLPWLLLMSETRRFPSREEDAFQCVTCGNPKIPLSWLSFILILMFLSVAHHILFISARWDDELGEHCLF